MKKKLIIVSLLPLLVACSNTVFVWKWNDIIGLGITCLFLVGIGIWILIEWIKSKLKKN
jgi:hypothetical protein